MTDETRDAAALYALGLLDADESRAFAELLTSDPALADLVNEYEAVAAVLSLSIEPVEAPAYLREAILLAIQGGTETEEKIEEEAKEKIHEEAPIAAPTVVPRVDEPETEIPRIEPRSSQWLPWSLAACFAILSAILFVKLRDSYDERQSLLSANAIENFRVAVLEAQTEELPNLSARVAWNEATGTGILDTTGFPDQPSDKDYQLWIFDGDNPAPVSAGVFDPLSAERIVFTPERSIGNAVAFAVSIEDAGGNPQPLGPVILVGKAGTG